jgi:hypothetical protein
MDDCTEAPKTLCIKGTIQNMEILVLIYYGSSHSFISQQVATQLHGVSECATTSRVQVANGSRLYCHSQLLNVGWFLQGYKFNSDLQVLDLPNLDMVVGMEWLERYSPMKVHWSQKWLTIPYQNSQVTLEGLTPGVLNCAMIELLHIQPNIAHSVSNQILPTVHQILDQFQHVFATTSELPPRRARDHTIPLVRGATPIHSRPYKYAPALKDEIEKQI